MKRHGRKCKLKCLQEPGRKWKEAKTHQDNREWWGLRAMGAPMLHLKRTVAPELQLLPGGNDKGPVLSDLLMVQENSDILMLI